MTALLGLLKQYWKPLVLALLIAISLYGIYRHGYAASDKEWSLKWAERDKADAVALEAREAQQRTEEQRRQNEINQVTADAQTQLDKARLDAANAKSAADKLQLSIASIRKQLAASETSKLSAIATAGPSSASAGLLFSDLFGESLKINQQLAAEADRSRIAGLACEQSYDAVANHAE